MGVTLVLTSYKTLTQRSVRKQSRLVVPTGVSDAILDRVCYLNTGYSLDMPNTSLFAKQPDDIKQAFRKAQARSQTTQAGNPSRSRPITRVREIYEMRAFSRYRLWEEGMPTNNALELVWCNWKDRSIGAVKYTWNTVVLDDSHLAKHRDNPIVSLVEKLPFKSITLLTATPAPTSGTDLFNQLQFMCFGAQIDHNWGLSAQAASTVGDIELLYHPQYDPMVEVWQPPGNEGTHKRVKGIFHPSTWASEIDGVGPHLPLPLQRCRRAYQINNGCRLWLLFPLLYLRVCRKRHRSRIDSQVLKNILSSEGFIRRTMHTHLTKPDGTLEFLSAKLPDLNVNWHEVGHSEAYSSTALAISETGAKSLAKQRPEEAPSPTALFFRDLAERQLGRYRWLDSIAFDKKLGQLFQVVEHKNDVKTLPHRIVRSLIPGAPQLPDRYDVQPHNTHKRSNGGQSIHVKALMAMADYHRSMYLWNLEHGIDGVKDVPPPRERLAELKWRLSDAPSGGAALRIVHDAVKGGERVLIMVAYPAAVM